jgi:Obg family GTPase CgtA
MAGSNFVDYVKIYCKSGKGGPGSKHLHRDNWTQKGGPDGGDGGRGGHIILRGNKNHWTLIHLKYARHIYAGHGGSGGHSRSFGKDGEDKVIEVPCGTVVYDAETGEFICDIKEHGEEIILAKALPHLYQPNSTLRTARRTNCRAHRNSTAESAGRRRFGGLPECRKIYIIIGSIGG